MPPRRETRPHAGAELAQAGRGRAGRLRLAELDRDEWLVDGALTDAEKALIEQRFRDLEANLHASIPWEKAKRRLMAPFKR